MTKELAQELSEANKLIDELENTINELEIEVEDLKCDLELLERQLSEYTSRYENNNCIRNTNEFIWHLKLENLFTENLEEFIKRFIKYYNN